MDRKRFEVYDNGFSKHIEDTYYTEDKHEHNLYDIWEMCRKLNELYKEKEMWKKECKRLKELYSLENENVELEDIIGLVKTDEPTNSVELKKELYK